VICKASSASRLVLSFCHSVLSPLHSLVSSQCHWEEWKRRWLAGTSAHSAASGPSSSSELNQGQDRWRRWASRGAEPPSHATGHVHLLMDMRRFARRSKVHVSALPPRAQIIMMFFEDVCVSRRCLHSFSRNYRFVIMYLMMTPPLSDDKCIFT